MALNGFTEFTIAAGIRRAEACPCGSGRRFKQCCGAAVGTRAPAEDPEPLARIRSLRAAGRFAEAEAAARAHVARFPDGADGLTALGVLLLHTNRARQALPVLFRALHLAPDRADNHFRLALAWERVGREDAAIAGLRDTLALDATHPASLERLGYLLTRRGERAEAADCHRRLAAAQPETLLGRLSHAKALLAVHNDRELEASLRETVTRFPDSSDAKRLLAEELGRQGRFDEAADLLRAAADGPPMQAALAFHELTAMRRLTEADAPLLDRMRVLLADETLPDAYRGLLHFGLGKACDDMHAYESAMRHFDTANGLTSPGQAFNRESFAHGVRALIDGWTPALLNAHADIGSDSEQPILILGMPRSGTTLVEQIVSSHPDVAPGGELQFWNTKSGVAMNVPGSGLSRELAFGIAAEFDALLDRVSRTAPRVTDKSPGNFLWIGLIRLVYPHARVIHCRRHPVDTCLSNYVTRFGERVPFARDKSDLVFHYRHYAMLMAHWRAVLPAAFLHEVTYENLIADPEPTIRALIAFCGLDWNEACLRPEANRRAVTTASVWQARQPLFRDSIERWRHYEPWLGPLRELLGDGEDETHFGSR